MKIMFVHNAYVLSGGEDEVYRAEKDLLVRNGHKVIEVNEDNKEINSWLTKVSTFLGTPFNVRSFIKALKMLRAYRPDVVHVHNYFPRISPSIFYACRILDVPVVHTLHNYRAICPTSFLMWRGKICERSVGNSTFWAVSKRVYRGSYMATIALVAMIELHKILGTWRNGVDRFIVLTNFSKIKYCEAGWPAEKIVVKPNFVPGSSEKPLRQGFRKSYALFYGRLSHEKGLDVLLDAWRFVDFNLKIVGDGPLLPYVMESASKGVEVLGKVGKSQLYDLIDGAEFVVVPSICLEAFGTVVIEAFSRGVPVIASNSGGLASLVEHEFSGLLFETGNGRDLAEKANWMLSNRGRVQAMGLNALSEYSHFYTAEKNYELLMGIYESVLGVAPK